MRILVTGGAGYIGSVVTEELLHAGHQVVVYDNLLEGHREAVAPDATLIQADLLDDRTLRSTLKAHRIEAVVHMAAHSSVAESCEQPEKYRRNNVIAGVALLEAMRDTSVEKIVFSSSAAVYGEPELQPIDECAPTRPTNPYGASKLEFEKELGNAEASGGLRHASLRYFNAAGATEKCGEHHNPETHLIPLVLQVAAGQRDRIEVYGDDYATPDGTCVRDYIHVTDLARAHILALAELDRGSATYNLGGGSGYSVGEVIDAAREVTGKDIPIRVGPRRAGDPPTLVASSAKIKAELGWRPRYENLAVIIESAWRWLLAHPNGY
jgi:UDP-glucose 4-epimerase